ncbi:MAG: DNA mismatch repair protein MutS [Lachnospiraceae bacterium]|nr:DNA mismatch repair protein MutS [Lachnospiraceae bacterium]
MTDTEKILEFDRMKARLAELSCTEQGKKMSLALEPFLSQTETEAALRDTTEGRLMIEQCGNPPTTALEGVHEYLMTAGIGGCLTAEQLEKVAGTLAAVKRMKDYLNRCKRYEISLPYYEENLDSMEEIREELNRNVRSGRVDDYASKRLKSLRESIVDLEEKMREKADQVMRANKNCMSDSFSTMRNGHVCIPVKREFKSRIGGMVMDQSATGNTLFMEPPGAAKYYEQLQLARLDEENEELRILYTLTGLLADKAEIMEQNFRTMEKLDFIFAKAKLSLEYGGTEPDINTERRIHLLRGRHPLMDAAVNVPLDFQIGGAVQGIVITGPNTGGKTVAIKTVALNCMMAQCGLHVAAEEADICMNDWILCDIGDGQNLSENLSTFSAHITNVMEILRKANRESLVVMDELGSGTDPAEGMGIAVAILEELKRSGALFLVTTHYPEVKHYAERTEGILNARMTFDRESLRPLYQLVLGEAGESCAFYIAERLGMPKYMLQRAALAAYGGPDSADGRTAYGDSSSAGSQAAELVHEKTRRIRKKTESRYGADRRPLSEKFRRGDSVMVYPDRKIGIVCTPVNEKGVLQVQLPNKKIWVNHKRVKLHVAAEELYPEDYDFSIVFDSVANRKARHEIERKYSEDAVVIYEDEN